MLIIINSSKTDQILQIKKNMTNQETALILLQYFLQNVKNLEFPFNMIAYIANMYEISHDYKYTIQATCICYKMYGKIIVFDKFIAICKKYTKFMS